MIFVDTGVWYSLLVPTDPNHQKTAKWFDSVAQPIVTSDYVVDETLTLLLMRGERSKAIAFGTLVIVGSTAILHKLSEDQFHRSWLL
jgi:predicted nucleic acid-binding protein